MSSSIPSEEKVRFDFGQRATLPRTYYKVVSVTPEEHEKPKEDEPKVDYKEWPKRVKVTGLPLMWSGWNNVYVRTKNIISGSPSYRLESYNLYGVIPILAVELKRRGNSWTLHRDCDWITDDFIKSVKLIDPKYPYGRWSDGMKVEMMIYD